MSTRVTRNSSARLTQSYGECLAKNKMIKFEQTDGISEAITSQYINNAASGSPKSDVTEDSPNIHNNDHARADVSLESIISDQSNSSERSENNNEILKFKIFQNITVKAPSLRGDSSIGEQPSKPNDISIYDYDEDGVSYNELNATDMDRKCKRCYKFFENPLDLLRHSRLCYVTKKILPPEEIEKYFDSPNRNFCPICEKPIKTRNFKSVFIKHLLVHTTGLTHECTICKKKFKRRDHMRAHRKRHIVCC